MYYNFYDPLPKFNKSANSDIIKNINVKHASVNIDTDKANPDEFYSVRTAKVKKSSTAKINKMHGKGTQQVWVPKRSN